MKTQLRQNFETAKLPLEKTVLLVASSIATALLIALASQAQAASLESVVRVVKAEPAYECIETATGRAACVSIPDDAPSDVSAQAASIASSALSPIARATGEELQGDALTIENEFAFDAELSPAAELKTRPSNTISLEEALAAQSQLRWVETFLKAGPASTGDLRVITSGKKR